MTQGNVTIIDDDRDTRQMLRMALEAEGLDVGEVQSGLRLVSTLHVDKPDVILMEVYLSWSDGIELCKSLRRNAAFREIPIVFISVRRRSEDIVAGLAAGAADYFPKPVHLARLIPRLREILAERRAVLDQTKKSAERRPEEMNGTDLSTRHGGDDDEEPPS